MADSPTGTSCPFGNNYLNPVRADEEALDPHLHAVGDAGRVGRSGLSRKDNTTSAPRCRRARAQAKLLLKLGERDATTDVDDEGRLGVFAVCSGSWGRGSSVAQDLQAPFDLLRAEG